MGLVNTSDSKVPGVQSHTSPVPTPRPGQVSHFWAPTVPSPSTNLESQVSRPVISLDLGFLICLMQPITAPVLGGVLGGIKGGLACEVGALGLAQGRVDSVGYY